MSALGTTVRVNSENQTLILAGEAVPRRPWTVVATPVDDPKLIIQGGFEDFSSESIALPRTLVPSHRVVASHRFVERSSAFSAASAYARTQELSVSSAHSAIIDTYA
jgi:hypothetical protein